jgi:uncharacterized protein DUF4333
MKGKSMRGNGLRLTAIAVSALLAGACGGSAKPATKATPTVLTVERVAPQLKSQLRAQTGKAVESIDCPDLPLPWSQGTSFHCQATFTDGTTMALFVSQTDAQGNVHWTEAG